MNEEGKQLTVARILRPRGNKGEVAALDLAGNMRCFEGGRRVAADLPAGSRLPLKIEHAWQHKGRLILKFAGIDSISDAEELRLAAVRLARDALETLPDGEYYLDDLVGCDLLDEASGMKLGKVADVYEPPGGVFLLSVLDQAGKELLVPFASEICRHVDIPGGKILVQLPEGLEELKV